MSNDDELRGQSSVYTAKDVLVRLDGAVERMDGKLDHLGASMQVLLSQDLNNRLNLVEREGSVTARTALELARAHETQWQRLHGMSVAIKALVGTSLLSIAGSIFALMKTLGWL